MSGEDSFDPVISDETGSGNANTAPSQSSAVSPPELFQLFASPNWYDSCVMDMLPNGIVLAASRNLILYLSVQEVDEDERDMDLNDRRHKLVLVRQLRAHQERISGVAVKPFSGAGEHRFVTCAHDSLVRLWSYETDTCLRELNLATLLSGGAGKGNKATCVVSSPRASTPLALIGMEGGQLVLWNHEADRAAVSSGKQAEKDGHAFHAAWWAPNHMNGSDAGEEYLAVGYKRGNVAVYSLQVGGATGGGLELRPMHRLRAHDDDVLQVCWNPHFCPEKEACPDLATAGRDRSVKLWRLSSRRCIAHLRIPLSGTNTSLGSGNTVGGNDDGQQKKSWTSLCWSQGGQGELYATTMYGDIIICSYDGESGNKIHLLSPGGGHRGHNRMIFALREHVAGRWLISVSQDRQICVWSPPVSSTRGSSGGGLLCSTPTIGGFVYALDVHPNNPSLMAIGCGDNTIRLWRHTDLRHQPCSVHTLWQGLNGRVTALAWHPVREGLLALGTEDGRVGVLDSTGSSSSGKMLPRFSHHHHKGQVYRVQWGPLCPPPAGLRSVDANSDAFMLYSVGNYQLRRHSASNLAREPVDVGHLLPRPSSSPGGINVDDELKFSDIAWRSDQMYFAVGLDTGTVLVYSCQPLACVANISLHNKCVNGIQWHPGFDLRAFNWLAIATCEHNVSVTDVGPLLGRFETAVMQSIAAGSASDEPQLPTTAQLTECMARLSGHGNRIVDLSWSPHEPGLLLSASFDGTAQVWDVRKARDHGLANFRGHHGRVYCCQWSWTDPDLVFTGGEDYCVIGWRPSQQEHALPTRGRRYRVQLPAGVKAPTGSSNQAGLKPGGGSRRQHTTSGGSSLGDMMPPSVDELKAMLEERRAELVTANGGDGGDVHLPGLGNAMGDKGQSTMSQQQQQHLSSSGGHKRKRPGLFANTNTSVPMDIRRRLDDAVELSWRLNNSAKEGAGPVPAYLSVFLRSPAAVLDACVEPEVAYQQRTGHLDNYFTLLLWSGQSARATTEAMRLEYLPDWLMAVLCGAQARELVDEGLVVAKARQLVQQQGDFVLAATYLLACDCLPQALALLREKNMFREAAVLQLLHQGGANSAVGPGGSALSDLYVNWATKEMSHGAYEMAAKAWLAADRFDEAIRVLSKRQTLYSCWTIARLCLSYGRDQQAVHWLRQLVNRTLTEPTGSAAGEEAPSGPVGVAQMWRLALTSAAANSGEDARLMALPSVQLFATVLDIFVRVRGDGASLTQLRAAVPAMDSPAGAEDGASPVADDGSVRPTKAQWPQACAYLMFDLAALLRCPVSAPTANRAPLMDQLRRTLEMCSSVDPDETRLVVSQLIGAEDAQSPPAATDELMAEVTALLRQVNV